MIEIPDIVANKAREVGADTWLDGLDELVAAVLDDWDLQLGRALTGGTEAYVTEVTRPDGSPAVLKLMIPRPHDVDDTAAVHEARFLRLVEGDGCAELYANDDSRGALLMERLGPSLHDLGVPLPEQHRIMVGCAASLWRRAPGAGFMTGAEKARWLIDFVVSEWERHGRPCTEAAVEYAVTCGERRLAAHDDDRAVLVHGDIHQWNTLRTLDGSGHKLVDPDGLLAEAEYDLGILMREDPVELMQGDPFDRAQHLAAWTGLDATATWEWGALERVSTGLVCEGIGLRPVGRQMLDAADRISARR